MAEAETENTDKSLVARLLPRRKRWRATLAAVLFLAAGLVFVWTQRERLADDVVADQLDRYDIPATYEIESITPDRQVLKNIVIGNPRRPDLTIERAVVRLRYGFGIPEIASVELLRPRLFASYAKGKLSFGSLDPLVYAPSDAPPGLPDIELTLHDGRALLETDHGPVGIKAEGSGWLPGGFAGTLAATAPQLAVAGCTAQGATLFGQVTTATGQASFAGPTRVEQLNCADQQLALGRSALGVKLTASPTFERVDASGKLEAGELRAAGVVLAKTGGTIDGTVTGKGLDARFELDGLSLRHPQAKLARVQLEGALRMRDGFAQTTVEGNLAGQGLEPGPGLAAGLASAARAGKGTLLAPLIDQARSAVMRQTPGSRVAAEFTMRQSDGALTLFVPSASVRSARGDALLSLSRVRLASGRGGLPRLTGNFITGGPGLPKMAGRMERQPNGSLALRMQMAGYAAGENRLAIPQLYLVQGRDGSLGFSGEAVASGLLPGGSTRNLRFPIRGSLGSSGALRVWNRCVPVSFDHLTFANLTLDRRLLTLCPGPQGAIVSNQGGAIRVAAGVASLNLSGRIGGTPITVASGPVGLAWPGAISAREVAVTLGSGAAANRFNIAQIIGRTGGDEISGAFTGAEAMLAAVPLDLRDASGTWALQGSTLTVGQGAFRLEDRMESDRFVPLMARDATLLFAEGRITANALMRNPASDRAVVDVALVHSLNEARGYADLQVAGLVFDEALQPDGLSDLALGVIANARGTVSGTGRIDWNSDAVTSSGVFQTDGLDFAAAFGPVRGARGTVRFTDLLNLTTAPDQVLAVDSINPGIEVFDGRIGISLRDGRTLSVTQGSWPFMGGRLTLEPVTMTFGVGEERRYIFRVEGLEAARFVQQMELGNLSATGVFDGVLPIVFDEMGNGRIEGGALDSRPPGGNVSYLGELTYKDLGAVANFAFAALRSLDYKVMNIRMDGPLTGEIVTRVRFDGVSQGAGTKRNFITRQIADLPIRFNVNIRAPFYQLITSIRAMYDPAFMRDPREIGLLTSDGKRLTPVVRPEPDAIKPDDLIPDEPPIQAQESESMP